MSDGGAGFGRPAFFLAIGDYLGPTVSTAAAILAGVRF